MSTHTRLKCGALYQQLVQTEDFWQCLMSCLL